MTCARCGDPAVVSRGDQDLCEECAANLDWAEIISIAQEAAPQSV